jgi:hypothetical protein
VDIANDLETVLSEAIDDEVFPVVNGRAFEETIEADDKFYPQLRGTMITIGGGFLFLDDLWLPHFPFSIRHRTFNSLKESPEKLLNALLRFLDLFRNL